MMEQLEASNRALFLALNAGEAPSAAHLHIAKFLAKPLTIFLPLLLIALWLWGGDARRRLALKAALASALGLILNTIIGWLYFHPRPEALALGHTYISHAHDASFPSNHATAFFAAGIILLAPQTKGFGWAVIVAGLAMGWARIFLGVHFPLDILGSLFTAGIAATALSPLWHKAGEPLTVFIERLYRLLLAPFIGWGWIRR